jgi:DNA-binding MarR family transcriptional regulator
MPPRSRSGELGPENRAEQRIGFLFKSLHQSLRQAVDEALRRNNLELSFAHMVTLFGLHFDPGSTGAQLARRAMVSPQTMTPLLRRLEGEGLIERRPHPDSRRADSWFLTDEGTTQFRQARAVADGVFTRMLSALDEHEVEHLQDYLRRCIAALGAVTAETQGGAKTASGTERHRRFGARE